jgi:hypothetical protein
MSDPIRPYQPLTAENAALEGRVARDDEGPRERRSGAAALDGFAVTRR